MNKFLRTATIGLSSVVLLMMISCSKAEKPAPTPDRFQLLTQTNWQLTNEFYEYRNDPASRVDFFTTDYKACEWDDVYRFLDNGTLVRSDSAISCGSDFRPFGFYTGGGWSTDSTVDNMRLELFMAYIYTFKIQKLNQTMLELRQDQKNYFQEDVSYTWRFKAVK